MKKHQEAPPVVSPKLQSYLWRGVLLFGGGVLALIVYVSGIARNNDALIVTAGVAFFFIFISIIFVWFLGMGAAAQNLRANIRRLIGRDIR